MVPIFVVLTILIVVSIDYLLQRRSSRRTGEAGRVPAGQPIDEGTPASVPPGLPLGLFVHPGHAWAEVQAGGRVRVGIDGFLQWVVGAPDRIAMLASGQRVSQGEPILALEQAGRRILVPSPVSGTIQASNERLASRPQSLGDDPYHDGWAYAIRPSRLGEEIHVLRVAEAATAWFKGEMERFTDWLKGLSAQEPLPALPDGGSPVAGVLGLLDDAGWAGFQAEFIGTPSPGIPEQLRGA
jgi:glycine cleavage system H protein